jgi:hypothetical protein
MRIDLDYEKSQNKIERDRRACLVHLSDLVRLHPEMTPPELIARLTRHANSIDRARADTGSQFPPADTR